MLPCYAKESMDGLILTILLCLYNAFIALNTFSYTVNSSFNWSPPLMKMNLEQIMDKRLAFTL